MAPISSDGKDNDLPQRNAPSTVSSEVLETEFLIIGAGPSGASLACFLASYGIQGIMISTAPGTANTPRAHITNMAALECLRDIGLDRDLIQVASDGSCMVHTRWCHSMAGEEYARLFSWGNDPKRKGDYETVSPCRPVDLPQTLLEPVLVRHATHAGFQVRFSTALTSFVEEEDGHYVAVLQDKLSHVEYKVRTRYLFGADGAKSRVAQQLDLPLSRQPGQGLAINVLVRADLSHLVDARRGNLHWVMQPDRAHPAFGWMGIVRMVKPWHEWMFILLPNRDVDHASLKATDEDYLQRVHELIGDETPVEILNVSSWFINEIVAEKYSAGNIFCLGDAVHRHPPFNGLGSNTCIQDAFNLAWKIAYVHRGWAHPSLLDSYSAERQPVGRDVITRANQGLRDHVPVWDALGALPPDVESRRDLLAELQAPGPAGAARRAAFQTAIEQTSREFHGLGIEMGQRYGASKGIYTADEPEPYSPSPQETQDPILYYTPSTYPGRRLPHAWLNKGPVPSTEAVSTIDLAGHGKFALFTGIGGEAWRAAAAQITAQTGVPIRVCSIGFRQEWEDFYFAWARLRGISESGVVLVRPDRFVAWRSPQVLGSPEACVEKLGVVMRSVLGFD